LERKQGIEMRPIVIRVFGLAASVGVVVAVVVLIASAGSNATGGLRSLPAASSANGERYATKLRSGLTARELRLLAFDVAKRNGDAVPSSIEAVRTLCGDDTERARGPA